MNVYKVNIPLIPPLNPRAFTLAAIERDEVVALRYLEDILGKEYFDLSHGQRILRMRRLISFAFITRAKRCLRSYLKFHQRVIYVLLSWLRVCLLSFDKWPFKLHLTAIL